VIFGLSLYDILPSIIQQLYNTLFVNAVECFILCFSVDGLPLCLAVAVCLNDVAANLQLEDTA